MKRPRLTAREIDALLIAAGAADPEATMESLENPKDYDRMNAAWASGMDKLRDMAAARYAAKQRRT